MKYSVVDVSETDLEELIRQNSDNIEPGLRFVDHQRKAGRGPYDVLMVDSGKALVVAELKVVEDDSMLTQGIDYYDYIASNIDGISHAYNKFNIDPSQEPRLLLIAPSFSISLINRCKWLSIPVSIFTFQCIGLEERKEEVIPVFKEMAIPTPPERVEIPTIEEHLSYITDAEARRRADQLLKQVKQWDITRVATEAIKWDISLKIGGRVFGYLGPRRKHLVINTWDKNDEWKTHPIRNQEDMENVTKLLKHNFEAVKADYGIK